MAGALIALSQKHERTGRPLGTDSFIEKTELLWHRKLKPKNPGPKKKDKQGVPGIKLGGIKQE